MLELSFKSKSLRQIVESDTEAIKALGQVVAKQLRHRIADLVASNSIFDVTAGAPQLLENTDQMLISLGQGYNLVLEANPPRIPRLPSGKINWAAVTRIIIIGIQEP